MRRTQVLTAAALAVVTLAGAAGTAYAAMSKTVTLTVDGRQERVHTLAATVSGALHAARVHVGPHDLVVPAENARIHNGSLIAVRHARQLSLDVNGVHRTVWVLAQSVGQALGELGYAGSFVAASRSSRIPLSGMSLSVFTPRYGAILVDGRVLRLVTTAPSVRQVLAQAHVRLAPTDRVAPGLAVFPANDFTIRVTRIRQSRVSQTLAIPFQTVRENTGSLYQGQTRVAAYGAPGAIIRVLQVTYVNGKLAREQLVGQRQTAAPHNQVILVGTTPVPPPPPPPPPPAPSSSGGAPGGSGLNWGALAQCESGGNPQAVSPGGAYRGLYQFTMSTWASVGGSGDPINASPGEQTYRAEILYAQSGSSPWPVCGHYLYS